MNNTEDNKQKQEESLDALIWEIANLTEDGISEVEFNQIKALLKSHIPQWIPCSERLPEVGQQVLIYCTSRFGNFDPDSYPSIECAVLKKETDGTLQFKEYSEEWPDWDLKDVSHWQPMPSAPVVK